MFVLQSVKCTFEKRGQYLRVWVEPLEHHDPDTEPPVVELTLTTKHIVHGQPVRSKIAVSLNNLSCACSSTLSSHVGKLTRWFLLNYYRVYRVPNQAV